MICFHRHPVAVCLTLSDVLGTVLQCHIAIVLWQRILERLTPPINTFFLQTNDPRSLRVLGSFSENRIQFSSLIVAFVANNITNPHPLEQKNPTLFSVVCLPQFRVFSSPAWGCSPKASQNSCVLSSHLPSWGPWSPAQDLHAVLCEQLLGVLHELPAPERCKEKHREGGVLRVLGANSAHPAQGTVHKEAPPDEGRVECLFWSGGHDPFQANFCDRVHIRGCCVRCRARRMLQGECFLRKKGPSQGASQGHCEAIWWFTPPKKIQEQMLKEVK